MAISTTPNFEPDFNSKSGYTDEHGFIQVVYPKNAPVLAENLNEMQQIADSKTSLISSSLVTDGVIPPEPATEYNPSSEDNSWYDDSWYDVKKSGNNALITFAKPFRCVCSNKIFNCNLQNISATFTPSSIRDGVNANLYLKIITDREITSSDIVYKAGYAISDTPENATINNYLGDEFADFDGKEISKRVINYIEGFSWNTNSTEASGNVPGIGGTVRYALLGYVTLNLVSGVINYTFTPNYSSIKIPYRYSVGRIEYLPKYIDSAIETLQKKVSDTLTTLKEAVEENTNNIKKLSDSAEEQLFNNFVAVKVTFQTETDGKEVITSQNQTGDIKKTNISSDGNNIVEQYYFASSPNTVYRTKTTVIGTDGNITITYK